MAALRTGTRTHHEELEKALALLAPPLSRDRFRNIIEGFFGFHRAWEPAVAAHGALRDFSLARHRLPALRHDLVTLGATANEIEALPLCPDAGGCAADADEALGSLYVIEGSTLGGQVISRALANEAWVPREGLRTFNPYGANAGAMWRGFIAFAEERGASRNHGKIVAGAQRTFDVLRRWLLA